MKRILSLIILFFLIGCAPKVSPYFQTNEYDYGPYNYVINEQLKIQLQAYGDIDFVIEEQLIKKKLKSKKLKLRNVLAYGKSNIEPYYEFFILHNFKSNLNLTEAEPYYVKDTMLNGAIYTFVGFSLDYQSADRDFHKLSKALKLIEN